MKNKVYLIEYTETDGWDYYTYTADKVYRVRENAREMLIDKGYQQILDRGSRLNKFEMIERKDIYNYYAEIKEVEVI